MNDIFTGYIKNFISFQIKNRRDEEEKTGVNEALDKSDKKNNMNHSQKQIIINWKGLFKQC